MSNRITASFVNRESGNFKQRLYSWMKPFHECAFFDTNQFQLPAMISGNLFDWIAAIGSINNSTPSGMCFQTLKRNFNAVNDWWFGYYGYDLKNEIESLSSCNQDQLNFPTCFFFQPEIIIYSKKGEITISINENSIAEWKNPLHVFEMINRQPPYESMQLPQPQFSSRISKKKYIENVLKILKHIQYGDVYELNYCLEFFATDIFIEPLSVFMLLQEFVPAPGACYFRMGNKYILSASPERFLRKDGNRLVSQPMKGTAARGLSDIGDQQKKAELALSEKERSENVMIVDLVRNDLSKIALKGSVRVDELFGIYTFPRVHQMISTVSCLTDHKLSVLEIIRKTFPMGSMTGAPKIRAMQLIEEFENTKRGVFSGAAGYITPNADFDFNVIIRSFLYEADKKYLSIMSGSAITANSDPVAEYEECLFKAGYSIQAIGGKLIEPSSKQHGAE